MRRRRRQPAASSDAWAVHQAVALLVSASGKHKNVGKAMWRVACCMGVDVGYLVLYTTHGDRPQLQRQAPSRAKGE
jgi:hypothetical protein